jgi:hypothetical protein
MTKPFMFKTEHVQAGDFDHSDIRNVFRIPGVDIRIWIEQPSIQALHLFLIKCSSPILTSQGRLCLLDKVVLRTVFVDFPVQVSNLRKKLIERIPCQLGQRITETIPDFEGKIHAGI